MPLFVLLSTVLCCIAVSAALAQDDARDGVQELGLAAGYGTSQRGNVEIIPLSLRAAWFLPDLIDDRLAPHHLNLKWFIEPWIAGVTNHRDAVEFGVSPVAFKLDYDCGQRLVPFLWIGVGVMYTSLQGLELGGPFEFEEFGGGGFHWFLSDTVALSASYRIRHMSNAGLETPNRGLDTHFFLLGLENFPRR
jgi:hypothetical protein